MPTVLIVDDEKNIRATLARGLRLEGYRTAEAADGREALALLLDAGTDLVILDMQMPELDGLELLQAMKDRGIAVPAIVLTAHGSIDKAVRAIKLGAFDFIEKPPSMERILLAARNALDRGTLLRENRRLAEDAGIGDEILGDSEAIRSARETIARVAATEAAVLLLGENGTGKELAARALHAGSSRARQPLVTVNCAAIPDTLFESELFGHVRGAFTGATEARRGKFQLADGGTLFLDEIGEIPPGLQPKLLRALDSGELERIGGGGPERVDVRVFAATNRDLEAEVRAGRFRPDLYYRLLVVPVTLPPLRARLVDIPLLAARFLAVACRKNRVRARTLSPSAIEALLRHSWPGNVRELRNAMERAAILASGEAIDASDLAFLALPGERPSESNGLASEMERHERAVVLSALERNAWKMTQTAAALGLERSHLYKKLKALGIERPAED